MNPDEFSVAISGDRTATVRFGSSSLDLRPYPDSPAPEAVGLVLRLLRNVARPLAVELANDLVELHQEPRDDALPELLEETFGVDAQMAKLAGAPAEVERGFQCRLVRAGDGRWLGCSVKSKGFGLFASGRLDEASVLAIGAVIAVAYRAPMAHAHLRRRVAAALEEREVARSSNEVLRAIEDLWNSLDALWSLECEAALAQGVTVVADEVRRRKVPARDEPSVFRAALGAMAPSIANMRDLRFELDELRVRAAEEQRD